MALTQTQVSELYVAVFGRASEGEGNAYWATFETTESAATEMFTLDVVSDYFSVSNFTEEANVRTVVEAIYLNALGKAPADDVEGIQYWVDSIIVDGNAMGVMVAGLVASANDPVNAGAAQDTFNNKVEVSNYTADTIETFTDFATFQGFIASVDETSASVDTAKTSVDGSSAFSLTTDAANAHYAEDLLIAAGGATAGELATAAALTLTTAEAAIAAGATQAEIDAELAILVAAGADEIAAAAAAAIAAQIVDLAEADAAVNTYLATLDADTDINASDDDISTTSAEVTTYYNGTVTDYEALVTVSQSVVATDTAASAAAKLALQEDANSVILATATDAATDASVAIIGGTDSNGDTVVGVTGLNAVNNALLAAHDATVAADAAAVLTESAILGASTSYLNTAANQELFDAATNVNGVITVVVNDADDTVFIDDVDLVLTEVNATTGLVSLVSNDDIAAAEALTLTADQIASLATQKALLADFITAFNADVNADLAALAALAAEEAANAAVQAIDPHANNVALANTVTTTTAAIAALVTAADTGEGDTGNTDATITTGTLVVAADGGITATVEGTADSIVATNIAGTITLDALFDAPDADVSALIAGVQARENAEVALTAGQELLTNTSPLGVVLASAEAAVVAAELTISTLADAVTALAESTVINDELTALELVASDAATALVGEFNLADTNTEAFGTNTVAMISDLVAGGTAEVTDFDITTDTIFFGDTYTANTGALTTGDDAVLELFITEGSTAADSLITFETKVFGSASASDFFTVELTGVTTAEIVADGGLIVAA